MDLGGKWEAPGRGRRLASLSWSGGVAKVGSQHVEARALSRFGLGNWRRATGGRAAVERSSALMMPYQSTYVARVHTHAFCKPSETGTLVTYPRDSQCMQTTPNLSHMIVPGPPRELLPSRPSNSRRIGPPPRRCRRARAKRRRSCNLSETRTRRVERPLTQRLNRSFALALGKKARSFRYCVPLEYSAFLPDPSLPSTSSVRRTRRRPLERPSPADPLWDSEVDVALERRLGTQGWSCALIPRRAIIPPPTASDDDLHRCSARRRNLPCQEEVGLLLFRGPFSGPRGVRRGKGLR